MIEYHSALKALGSTADAWLRLQAKVSRLAPKWCSAHANAASDNRLDALATDDVKQGERGASGTFRATLQL